MTLDPREQDSTRNELAANLELAQTTPARTASAVGLSPARIHAALAVAGARPEDVWLVRDYFEHLIRSRGQTPVPYSKLPESMRASAKAWFPLVDIDQVVKGTKRPLP
jgi:hypothetical protein